MIYYLIQYYYEDEISKKIIIKLNLMPKVPHSKMLKDILIGF